MGATATGGMRCREYRMRVCSESRSAFLLHCRIRVDGTDLAKKMSAPERTTSHKSMQNEMLFVFLQLQSRDSQKRDLLHRENDN
ncbi:hypothetical protein BN2475_600052 [Paraburkholderia ribeironis]|uniref:Uncharacterized protein n=1 Tax=Paraburkholderia ribeironis TaxID=1247936 RepID=A0A1N7SEZ9_9BURK|nr:hypothetical protein BN2475_600052 [Paraburkholderia ribeironis]